MQISWQFNTGNFSSMGTGLFQYNIESFRILKVTYVMQFNIDNLNLRYEPFPIGISTPLMDSDTYDELVSHFPPIELFSDYRHLGKPGDKYTLSEKEDPRSYHKFIKSDVLWQEFHQWVKSDTFIYHVIDTLKEYNIDLGYRKLPYMRQQSKRFLAMMRGHHSTKATRLRSRFEFSALSADGGHLNPHTDSPGKIVTLIVSMVRQGEWNAEYGGGTNVNKPKHLQHCFNQLNQLASFDDMETIHTYAFKPNQAILFVKTFNSWHSVSPMKGVGSNLLRKTLTINIEAF